MQKNKKARKKAITGVVTSDKMNKTIVVRVTRLAKHSKYGKSILKSNKFKAHDEKNQAKIGDTVKIVKTRPLSKDKRWRLVEIVGKGND